MRASERFFSNVLWNWLGVGVNIASGVLFTPFLIRRLGPEGYGMWALAFAMVEYFWLGDLGFRSATLKFTAEYRAKQDAASINAVINAALVYFGAIALLLCAVTGIVAANAGQLFAVSAANHAVFERVVLIAGWNWALSLVFQTFRAGLEAFQRFDLDSRVWMAAAAFRLAGSVALLLAGFGIIELALMVAAAQAAGYAGAFYCFRRVFPELRLSPRLASREMFRQMLAYGTHTFTAVVSLQALGQSAAVLTGHFLSAATAGYYNVAQRILQMLTELTARVGTVAGANATEMETLGKREALLRMAILANRYCLLLYLAAGVVLLPYGGPFLRLWAGPAYEQFSLRPLLVLYCASALAVAGQFSSSSILYGVGQHAGVARGAAAEALFVVPSLFWVIPRYGIDGAATVVAIGMVGNRAVLVPWILTRHLGTPLLAFLRSIYGVPLLIAVPATLLSWCLRNYFLAGDTWVTLASGAVVGSAFYAAMAAVFCLEAEHRRLIAERVGIRIA